MNNYVKRKHTSQKLFLELIAHQYKETYIYGYGTYAKVLNLFLKKNGIDVKGYILDKEYIDSKNLKNNKEVIIWETLEEKPEKDFIVLNGITKDPSKIKSKWYKLYKPVFIDVIDFINIGEEFLSLNWLKENKKDIDHTKSLLKDKTSKDVLNHLYQILCLLLKIS